MDARTPHISTSRVIVARARDDIVGIESSRELRAEVIQVLSPPDAPAVGAPNGESLGPQRGDGDGCVVDGERRAGDGWRGRRRDEAEVDAYAEHQVADGGQVSWLRRRGGTRAVSA
jgi:hypothetical protein